MGGGRSTRVATAAAEASRAASMTEEVSSAFDDELSAAGGGRESGAGMASVAAAARVSGDAAAERVAAAFLLGAGELVAFVLGAVRRVVAAVAAAGLVTDRETGRVAGEAVALVRGVAEVETVDDEDVTDRLVDRETGRVTGRVTAKTGREAVEAAGALLTERDAGLVGVAVAAREAALVADAAELVVGRVVTEREAGREGTGGAASVVGGRGEEDVRDLLAGRAAVCTTGATAGERIIVGMRDGSSLRGVDDVMAAGCSIGSFMVV